MHANPRKGKGPDKLRRISLKDDGKGKKNEYNKQTGDSIL